MLKLLFLIFLIFPLGKCQDLFSLCIFPPLEELCMAAQLITTFLSIFGSMDSANDENAEVLDGISDLSKQIQENHDETMKKLELITDLLRNLPVEIKLDRQKEIIASFISSIDVNFNDLLLALKEHDVARSKELAKTFFANKLGDLDDLRSRLVPSSSVSSIDGGFFPTLFRSLTYENRLCSDNISVQEALISMWRMMIKAEIKLYLLLQAFYRITLKKNAYKKRMKIINIRTNEHIVAYSRAVYHTLKTAYDFSHEACDPDNNAWLEYESFHHLNGLHNPVLFRYYEDPEPIDCGELAPSKRPEQSRWIHIRFDCVHDLESCVYAGVTTTCVSSWDGPVIKWLDSSELGKGGSTEKDCPSETAEEFVIGKPGFLTNYERTCLCYCTVKIPVIYTGEIKTNKKDNYVITGLRFVRDNNDILYLQPQEGKLGVYGKVSNFSWIDVPIYDEKPRVNITTGQNIIFLDDVRLPLGHVMTGIAFAIIHRPDGMSGFGIVAIGTPYDYKSGKLDLDRGYEEIVFADPPQSRGLEFVQINPTHVHSDLPNKASSLDYNYVTLSPSTYSDDVEASFLPLINAIPVTSEYSPLTGIRLFHKGNNKHAGFISLGVHQVHYVELLNEFIKIYEKNGTEILKAGIMKQDIFV